MAFNLGEDLGGKLGPAPVWAWIAGGAGLVVAISLILKKKAAASSASSTTATPVSAVNPFLFGAGSGLGSGGSTGSGGGTTTPPVGGGAGQSVELGSFAQNLAAGLVPLGGGGASGDRYSKGGNDPGILALINVGGIYGTPDGQGGLVGVKFANPAAPWQTASNNALAALLSQQPATVPVGDLYGGIGYQSPAAAAAGGYWGQNGQWVATPTPWNPNSANPPLGGLAPGTPYVTGTAPGLTPLPQPGAGAVVGTPAHYSAYTPGAVNPANPVALEFAAPEGQSAAALSPWRAA